MSHVAEPINILDEQTRIEQEAATTGFRRAVFTGVILIVASLVLGLFVGEGAGFASWLQSWLISVSFWMTLAAGGLFFVLIQHLARAGWSVTVRRMAEFVSLTVVVVAAAAVPIIVGASHLYEWTDPDGFHNHGDDAADHAIAGGNGPLMAQANEAGDGHAHADAGHAHGDAGHDHTHAAAGHGDHSDHGHDAHGHSVHVEVIRAKAAYLNIPFWIVRIALVFAIWFVLSRLLFKRSVEQDTTGDHTLTNRMEAISAPGMILFAVTLTVVSFDLLMSLTPAWFSTIYGVYLFAGSAMAINAFLIVLGMSLQRAGVLKHAITDEHYHDLGKLMYAFMVFWAYIAFSQYMLIWYANIPEETIYYLTRASGEAWDSGWNAVSIALLAGHLFIPLLGFMSRHVKRRRALLFFWALWMLAIHYVDLYWLVRPTFDPGAVPVGKLPADLLAWLGLGALVIAMIIRLGARYRVVPIRDPRINESLVFENF